MSENEDRNDLLDALNSVEEVNVGDVVKGEVLTIDDDRQVIVGIEGAGVEGVVPAKELSTKPVENVKDEVKVGDVLDLVVISKIGNDKEMVATCYHIVVLNHVKFGTKFKNKLMLVKQSQEPLAKLLRVDLWLKLVCVDLFLHQ